MTSTRLTAEAGRLRHVLALLLLLGPAPAFAALAVDLRVDGERVVVVSAVNDGPDAAHEVHPEVSYRHRSTDEPPVELAPGERREWRFPLDAPPEGGTLPAVVRVRYVAAGRSALVPAVATVAAPGAASEPVHVELDAPPIAGVAHGVLIAENPGSVAVAARAAFVLPAGLDADPASMPAEIPARGRVRLPVVLQNVAAVAPGNYPAFAILEYGTSGVPHTAVTRATLRVVGEDARRRWRPLVIGTSALAVALAIIAFALRWTAPGRRA